MSKLFKMIYKQIMIKKIYNLIKKKIYKIKEVEMIIKRAKLEIKRDNL